MNYSGCNIKAFVVINRRSSGSLIQNDGSRGELCSGCYSAFMMSAI